MILIIVLLFLPMVNVANAKSLCEAGTFCSSKDFEEQDAPTYFDLFCKYDDNIWTRRANQQYCKICPVGFSQNVSFSENCKACPPGSSQSNVRQTSCTSCAIGKYQDKTRQSYCKNCAEGTYQENIGSVDCNDCSDGGFSLPTGLTSCVGVCEDYQLLVQGQTVGIAGIGGNLNGSDWYCINDPSLCSNKDNGKDKEGKGTKTVTLTDKNISTAAKLTIGLRCRCTNFPEGDCSRGRFCSIKEPDQFHKSLCTSNNYCWSNGMGCRSSPEPDIKLSAKIDSELSLKANVDDEPNEMNGQINVRWASAGYPGQSQRLQFQGCLPYFVNVAKDVLDVTQTTTLTFTIPAYITTISSYSDKNSNAPSLPNYKQMKSQREPYQINTTLDTMNSEIVLCGHYCSKYKYFGVATTVTDIDGLQSHDCSCGDTFLKDISPARTCQYDHIDFTKLFGNKELQTYYDRRKRVNLHFLSGPCQRIYDTSDTWLNISTSSLKVYNFPFGFASVVPGAKLQLFRNESGEIVQTQYDVTDRIKHLLGHDGTLLLVETMKILVPECADTDVIACRLEKLLRFNSYMDKCTFFTGNNIASIQSVRISDHSYLVVSKQDCESIVKETRPDAIGARWYAKNEYCDAVTRGNRIFIPEGAFVDPHYQSCLWKKTSSRAVCPGMNLPSFQFPTKKSIAMKDLYVDAPRQDGRVVIRATIIVQRIKFSYGGGISIICSSKTPASNTWSVIHRERFNINQFSRSSAQINSLPFTHIHVLGSTCQGTHTIRCVIQALQESTSKPAINTITGCQDNSQLSCNFHMMSRSSIYDPSYDSSMLSSSGNWGNDKIGTSYGSGRLGDTARAWSAAANNQNQWWQINAPVGSTVTGAAVKGRVDYCGQYVKKWKFQYFDGAAWQWVDNGAEFDGTQSEAVCNTQIDIIFSAPINTTKIRFRPWVWNQHISARMGLLIVSQGCQDFFDVHETSFTCEESEYSTDKSKTRPVPPRAILQHQKIGFMFGNSGKTTVPSFDLFSENDFKKNIETLTEIQTIQIDNFTKGKRVYVDVAFDRPVQASFANLEDDTLSVSGPVQDTGTDISERTSNYVASAPSGGWWSVNLLRKPFLPQFQDYEIHLELNTSQTDPQTLQVFMTTDFVPITAAQIANPFYRCGFNNDPGNVNSCFSFLESRSWHESKFLARSDNPEGDDALVWETSNEVVLNQFPTSLFPISNDDKGFSITFWAAFMTSPVSTDIKLVKIMQDESFITISTSTGLPNSLRFDMKINNFERHYSTATNTIPTFEWTYFAVTVSSLGEVHIFINGKESIGKYVDQSRSLKAFNVHYNNRSIQSTTFWYSDGTRMISPGEAFGPNLKSDLVTGKSGDKIEYEIWDIHDDTSLTVEVFGKEDHELVISNSKLGNSTKSTTNYLVIEPHELVGVQTLYLVVRLKTDDDLEVKVSNGIIRRTTGREVLATGNAITKITIGTNALENSRAWTMEAGISRQYSAIGSYLDKYPRAMRAMRKKIANTIRDVVSCSSACASYKYFALQAGKECYCDNDLDHSTQYGTSMCSFTGGNLCNYIYQHVGTCFEQDQSTTGCYQAIDHQFISRPGIRHEKRDSAIFEKTVLKSVDFQQDQSFLVSTVVNQTTATTISGISVCLWVNINSTRHANTLLSLVGKPHTYHPRCGTISGIFSCGKKIRVGPSENNTKVIANLENVLWCSSTPINDIVGNQQKTKTSTISDTKSKYENDQFIVQVLRDSILVTRSDQPSLGWGQNMMLYCVSGTNRPSTLTVGTISENVGYSFPERGLIEGSCKTGFIKRNEGGYSSVCVPLPVKWPYFSFSQESQVVKKVNTVDECLSKSRQESSTNNGVKYKEPIITNNWVELESFEESSSRFSWDQNQPNRTESTTAFNGSYVAIVNGNTTLTIDSKTKNSLNNTFCFAVKDPTPNNDAKYVNILISSETNKKTFEGYVELNNGEWIWKCFEVRDKQDHSFVWHQISFQLRNNQNQVLNDNFQIDQLISSFNIIDLRVECTFVVGLIIRTTPNYGLERYDFETHQYYYPNEGWTATYIDDTHMRWRKLSSTDGSASIQSSLKRGQVRAFVSDRKTAVDGSKENFDLTPNVWQHVCASIDSVGKSFISVDGQSQSSHALSSQPVKKFASTYQILLGQSPVGEWKDINNMDSCYGFWRDKGDSDLGGWSSGDAILCPTTDGCQCQPYLQFEQSANFQPFKDYSFVGKLSNINVYNRALSVEECRVQSQQPYLSNWMHSVSNFPSKFNFVTLEGVSEIRSSFSLVASQRKYMALQGERSYKIKTGLYCNRNWIISAFFCSSSLDDCVAESRARCNGDDSCNFISVGWAPLLNPMQQDLPSPLPPREFSGVKIRNLQLTQEKKKLRTLKIRFQYFASESNVYAAANGLHVACFHLGEQLKPTMIWNEYDDVSLDWVNKSFEYKGLHWRDGIHAIRCSILSKHDANDKLTELNPRSQSTFARKSDQTFDNIEQTFSCSLFGNLRESCGGDSLKSFDNSLDGLIGYKNDITFVDRHEFSWIGLKKDDSIGHTVKMYMSIAEKVYIHQIKVVNLCAPVSRAKNVHVQFKDVNDEILNEATIVLKNDCGIHVYDLPNVVKSANSAEIKVLERWRESDSLPWRKDCDSCQAKWTGVRNAMIEKYDLVCVQRQVTRLRNITRWNMTTTLTRNATCKDSSKQTSSGRRINSICTRETITNNFSSNTSFNNGTNSSYNATTSFNATSIYVNCSCNRTWIVQQEYIVDVCNITGTDEPGTWLPETNITIYECQKRCIDGVVLPECYGINFHRLNQENNIGTCELLPKPPLIPNVLKEIYNSWQKPNIFFSGRFETISSTVSILDEVWLLPDRPKVGLAEVELISKSSTTSFGLNFIAGMKNGDQINYPETKQNTDTSQVFSAETEKAIVSMIPQEKGTAVPWTIPQTETTFSGGLGEFVGLEWDSVTINGKDSSFDAFDLYSRVLSNTTITNSYTDSARLKWQGMESSSTTCTYNPLDQPSKLSVDVGDFVLAAVIDGTKNTWNYDQPIWTDNSVFDGGGETKTLAFNTMKSNTIRIVFEHGDCNQQFDYKHNLDMTLNEIFGSGEHSGKSYNSKSPGKSAWTALGCGDFAEQVNCNRHGFNVDNKIRYGIMFNNEDDCSSSDVSIGIGIRRDNIAAGGQYGCCASNGKNQDVTVTAKIYVQYTGSGNVPNDYVWNCNGEGDEIIITDPTQQLILRSVRIGAKMERMKSAEITITPASTKSLLQQAESRSGLQNIDSCSLTSKTMTYANALNYCFSLGHVLPVIHDPNENLKIRKTMGEAKSVWLPIVNEKWENKEEPMYNHWENDLPKTHQCTQMNANNGMWESVDCAMKNRFICCDRYETTLFTGSLPRLEMRFGGWEKKQKCNTLHPTLHTTPLNYYLSPSSNQLSMCRQNEHPATPPMLESGYTFMRCRSNINENMKTWFIGNVNGQRECALRCRKHNQFFISRSTNSTTYQCYCKRSLTEELYEVRKTEESCTFKMTSRECQSASNLLGRQDKTVFVSSQDKEMGICRENSFVICSGPNQDNKFCNIKDTELYGDGNSCQSPFGNDPIVGYMCSLRLDNSADSTTCTDTRPCICPKDIVKKVPSKCVSDGNFAVYSVNDVLKHYCYDKDFIFTESDQDCDSDNKIDSVCEYREEVFTNVTSVLKSSEEDGINYFYEIAKHGNIHSSAVQLSSTPRCAVQTKENTSALLGTTSGPSGMCTNKKLLGKWSIKKQTTYINMLEKNSNVNNTEKDFACPQLAGDYGADGIITTIGTQIYLTTENNNNNNNTINTESIGTVNALCQGSIKLPWQKEEHQFHYTPLSCSIYWASGHQSTWIKPCAQVNFVGCFEGSFSVFGSSDCAADCFDFAYFAVQQQLCWCGNTMEFGTMKHLDSRVCVKAGFPSDANDGVRASQIYASRDKFARWTDGRQFTSTEDVDLKNLPEFDQYLNAFSVFKNTIGLKIPVPGSPVIGELQQFWSDEKQPEPTTTILGPIDVAGHRSVERMFYIPRVAAIDEHNADADAPVDVLFEMRLWFIGAWPRRGGAHNLKVVVGGKVVYSLDGAIVCSEDSQWKGHLKQSRFDNHWTKNQLLLNTTCYVDISNRAIHTGSRVSVKIYMTGNIGATSCFIGISHEKFAVMNAKYIVTKNRNVPTNNMPDQVALGTAEFDLATNAAFVAGVQYCAQDGKCGNQVFAGTGAPIVIDTTLTVQLVNNTYVKLLSKNSNIGGVPLQSIRVRWSSCLKSGCMYHSKSFNAQASIDNHFHELFLGVTDVTVPLRIGVQLCNSLELSHGCSMSTYSWNFGKDWASSIEDRETSATLVPGSSILNGTLDITSRGYAIETFPIIVKPTLRKITWSHAFKSSTTDTINAWVGCFNMPSNQDIPGFVNASTIYHLGGAMIHSTEACALVCQSRNFVFSILGSTNCQCTHEFPLSIQQYQVTDSACGTVCLEEETFVPTRYCGTIDSVGVWRVPLVAIQTRGYQYLIGNASFTPEGKLDDTNCDPEIDLERCKYTFPCTGLGYVMFSKQQLHERIGIDWTCKNNKCRDRTRYADHFACVYFSQSTRTWNFDLGNGLVAFSPVSTDVVVAIVDSSVGKPISTRGQYSILELSLQLGFMNGDIEFLPVDGDCKASDSYLLIRCFSVHGFGFSPLENKIIFSGALNDPISSLSSSSTTYSRSIKAFKNGIMDPINGLADLVGPFDYQVSSQLCTERGTSNDDYPSICTVLSPETSVEVLSSQDSPFPPGTPVAESIELILEEQSVYFISISWRPSLYWGRGSLAANVTRGFEFQIIKINQECPERLEPDLETCLFKEINHMGQNGVDLYFTNASQIETPVLGVTPIIEARNCRFGASLDDVLLPICSCGPNQCNAATLARDMLSESRMILGDLYNASSYRIRLRSTVHNNRTIISPYRLSSNVLESEPILTSSWTSWSETFTTVANSSKPSRPPQPIALEAGYTAVRFRIYRAAWNRNPITSYVFQMAKDTACGDLSNLDWSEIDSVNVPVSNTFLPYIEFLRGDEDKGGIGPAIIDPVKYHFRVAAVNAKGLSNYSDYKNARNPVQLGVLNFPAFIWPNHKNITRSTCEDETQEQPLCPDINTASSVFNNLVDMKFMLRPSVNGVETEHIYFWSDISFGREGATVFGNSTIATDTIIDCNGKRCFKFCRYPLYEKKGPSSRCFPPSVLKNLVFRNGRSKNGDGGVLLSLPAVSVLQRRNLILKNLIFYDNYAENGSGGAIAVRNRQESARVIITDCQFMRNSAFKGAGGAISIDSSKVSILNTNFKYNFAYRHGIDMDEEDTNSNSNTNRRLLSSNVTSLDELEDTPKIAVDITGSGGAVSVLATTSGSVIILKHSNVLSNGAASAGGGFFVLGSKLFVDSPTISVDFFNNSAELGGNIYLESSTLVATRPIPEGDVEKKKHLLVRDGRAKDFGGGIACVGSTIDMHESEVKYNSAGKDGGGLYGVLCLMNGLNSGFLSNRAGFNGGGLYFSSISNIVLDRVIIEKNHADVAGLGGSGGGLTATRARLLFITDSEVKDNQAAEGGGLNLDQTQTEPVLQNLKISGNTAFKGGGGGVMWELRKPLLIQTELIKGKHKKITDMKDIMLKTFTRGCSNGPTSCLLGDNTAQYGNKIASGITTLKISMLDDEIVNNTLPFNPVIQVQVLDYYNRLVKRLNKPTSVIATVKSGKCLHLPNRSMLGKCPSLDQGLRGKTVQEIPGQDGQVNFTGLGLRGWPGQHTLKIEIPGVDFAVRTVFVRDCDRGHFLLTSTDVNGQSTGDSVCEQCPGGKYKPDVGIWPCTQCLAGFACPRAAISPISCPPGEVQSQPGQLLCTDCLAGYYQDQSEKLQCLTCEAGQYANISRSILCQNCVPGLSQQSVGSSLCTTCGQGEYSKIYKATTCEKCPTGWAQNYTKNIKCNICNIGEYAESEGRTDCQDCKAGEITLSKGSPSCIVCGEGKFSNNSRICTSCTIGQFNDKKSRISCEECPKGYFAEDLESFVCNECPAGYIAKNVSEAACTVCLGGTYAAEAAKSKCETCSSGRRTFETAPTSCADCVPGRASGSESAISCLICPRGYTAEKKQAAKCDACPAGFHIEFEEGKKCKICPEGTACVRASVSPEICSSGSFSPREKSTVCSPCVAGRAQSKEKQTACDTCFAGKFSAGERSKKCSKCNPGKFSPNEIQNLKCDICPQGFATNKSADSKCGKCPIRHKSTLEEESTTCTACILGEIQTPDTRTCWYCVAETFSLDAGEQLPTEFDEEDKTLAICHKCPEGGTCKGGYHLKPKNTWWRSSNMSTIMTQCFEQSACLGATNPDTNLNMPPEIARVEHNESCAVGYRGRLCHACAAGYGRETFDSCSICPPKASNKLLMVFGLILVVLVLIFFIIFTVRSASDERSNASMMFKTLAAYGQVVGIASLFPYRWPPTVLKLFDMLEAMTSVSDRILNTDCAMEDTNRLVPLTYEKAVLYMVGPLVFVACAFVFWCTVHLCLRYVWGECSKKPKNKTIHKQFSWKTNELRLQKVETRNSAPSLASLAPLPLSALGVENSNEEEKISSKKSKDTGKPLRRKTSLSKMKHRVSVAAQSSKKSIGKFNNKMEQYGQEWTWVDTKRYIVVSTLICMVILHPTLTRQSLFLFMCVPINERIVIPGNETMPDIDVSVYLRKDVQLECYTAQHWSFALLVGLPGVIGYVIGTPLLTFYVLYKRRHKLTISGPSGDETRKTYGFIYLGYSLYYWEVVIMTRKVSMVIVAVFGLRATVQTQALMALLVVLLAGAAHIYAKPFDIPILDRLELYGLLTAFITLYFGMFFFTRDVEESPFFLAVITTIILSSNFAFISYWCVSLYHALCEEVMLMKRFHILATLWCFSCKQRYCMCCRCKHYAFKSCKKMLRRLSLRNRNLRDSDDDSDDEVNDVRIQRRSTKQHTVWSSMRANGVEKENLSNIHKRLERQRKKFSKKKANKRALELVPVRRKSVFELARLKLDNEIHSSEIDAQIRANNAANIFNELGISAESKMNIDLLPAAPSMESYPEKESDDEPESFDFAPPSLPGPPVNNPLARLRWKTAMQDVNTGTKKKSKRNRNKNKNRTAGRQHKKITEILYERDVMLSLGLETEPLEEMMPVEKMLPLEKMVPLEKIIAPITTKQNPLKKNRWKLAKAKLRAIRVFTRPEKVSSESTSIVEMMTTPMKKPTRSRRDRIQMLDRMKIKRRAHSQEALGGDKSGRSGEDGEKLAEVYVNHLLAKKRTGHKVSRDKKPNVRMQTQKPMEKLQELELNDEKLDVYLNTNPMILHKKLSTVKSKPPPAPRVAVLKAKQRRSKRKNIN